MTRSALLARDHGAGNRLFVLRVPEGNVPVHMRDELLPITASRPSRERGSAEPRCSSVPHSRRRKRRSSGSPASGRTDDRRLPPHCRPARGSPCGARARCFSGQPTSGLPVNVTSGSADPRSSPRRAERGRERRSTVPPGTPPLRPPRRGVARSSGVCDAGRSTILQPEAIPGADLVATRFRGKLNGVIARIGPTGLRR